MNVDQAFQANTDIIIAELQQPRYVEHRRNAVFNARYQTLAPEQQTIFKSNCCIWEGYSIRTASGRKLALAK